MPLQNLIESLECVLLRAGNRRMHAFAFVAAIFVCALLALFDAHRKLGAVGVLVSLCVLVAAPYAVAKLFSRLRSPSRHRTSESGTVGSAVERVIFTDVAVVVGVLLMVWLSPTIVDFGTQARFTYSTKVGERRVIPLADRGQVTLNTNSDLELRVTDHAVEASLVQGEALFSMEHPSVRPFTLFADGLVVKDVGTVFDVKHRAGGGIVVVVARGSVTLSAAQTAAGQPMPFSPVVVREGQIAVREDNHVQVKSSDPEEVERELMWTRGRLTFAQTTVAEIAAELNRYNRIQLVIEDHALAERRLSVALQTTNPEVFVSELGALFRPLTVTTRREGDTIRVGLERARSSDRSK